MLSIVSCVSNRNSIFFFPFISLYSRLGRMVEFVRKGGVAFYQGDIRGP